MEKKKGLWNELNCLCRKKNGMRTKRREYHGKNITINFELKRCIHAAECIRGLPAEFNLGNRPWIQADAASADEIASVIERCPSGALHVALSDGNEGPAAEFNSVMSKRNGPLYLRGDLRIKTEKGETLRETRAALCRCGESENKPFCDNSHREIKFQASGFY